MCSQKKSPQNTRNNTNTKVCFIDATMTRVLDSDAMASCIVSFVDTEGIRHTVEVEAESLFEAAALAIRTFKQHQCEPGLITKLDVEIRSCITHTVTRKRIHDWLHGGAKSPREAVLKERLRELLDEEVHVNSNAN